ncbi:MAG: RNA polymerase sigma factor [Clostridia bacterium]|nr:RNA polymerase sigma factor [Clostridia bacterium]
MQEEERALAVERWGGMVWRLALARMANVPDAEDVFQDVFLRYFRHEDDFASDEHRRNWLIRCTLNRAKSALSAPWRRRILPLDTAAEVGVRGENGTVYAAVLGLPAKYRTAIHLHYYEGFSVSEIAALLGCAEGTVKSQLSRARAMLREQLWDAEI